MLMSACVNVILLAKTWIDDKQSRKSNHNGSFLFIHIFICNSIKYLYSKKLLTNTIEYETQVSLQPWIPYFNEKCPTHWRH